MLGWLGGRAEPDPSDQNAVQSLRLELQECARNLESARREVELLRAQSGRAGREAVARQLEDLMSEVAAPLASLALQQRLLDQGTEVRGRDVMALSRRVVEALLRLGLTLEGEPGGAEAYDAERHEPLSLGTNLAAGEAVVVKVPGVSFQGRRLKKAMVEKPLS